MNLARQQTQLIEDLRKVEEDILNLQRKRHYLKRKLSEIYPEARQLTTPPKDKGIVLSILNYRFQNFTCRVFITPEGLKQIDDPNPHFFTQADMLILALCAGAGEQGANADKLLTFPDLTARDSTPHRRVHKLVESKFLSLKFMPVLPKED